MRASVEVRDVYDVKVPEDMLELFRDNNYGNVSWDQWDTHDFTIPDMYWRDTHQPNVEMSEYFGPMVATMPGLADQGGGFVWEWPENPESADVDKWVENVYLIDGWKPRMNLGVSWECEERSGFESRRKEFYGTIGRDGVKDAELDKKAPRRSEIDGGGEVDALRRLMLKDAFGDDDDIENDAGDGN
jgi:hypothetical protein